MNTMQDRNKVVIVNGKAIVDIDTLFARLLVVGQKRGVDVTDIFQCELCPVPPSLIERVLVFGKRRYNSARQVSWGPGH